MTLSRRSREKEWPDTVKTTLDGLLRVLENPTRRRIMERLARESHYPLQLSRELGVSQQVTTFTASDFGRTFAANDSGTDHGWGSHQFVLGGAVQGGKLFGTFPTLAVDGPDDTEDGRWIPTTSVDEFSATLATWFGVSNSDLATVLPNIGRFAHSNLGFLG